MNKFMTKFEKLTQFFVWNTGSDLYEDPNMDCIFYAKEKKIIVQGRDTNQTLVLKNDGTWELTD